MKTKTLALLAAIVLAAVAFYWTGYGTAPTSPNGVDMGGTGTDLAEGAIVSVALPDTLSERATMGKTAFEAKCAACHGTNAAGRDGKGPPLVHKIYEPNHHADIAFVMAVRNGVRSHHWTFGNMPPVEGLTEADTKMIAAYVRELQKENGIF